MTYDIILPLKELITKGKVAFTMAEEKKLKRKRYLKKDFDDTEEVEIELTIKVKAFRGELLYQGFRNLDDPEQLAELGKQIGWWGVHGTLSKRWEKRHLAYRPLEEPMAWEHI